GCTEMNVDAWLYNDRRGSESAARNSWEMHQAADGFIPLYRTDDVRAAENSIATVHGVLHLAWVEEGGGRHRAHMAVYVKPRGRLGKTYMMLIGPFRHLIVYPSLMRAIGRAWDARGIAGLSTAGT